MGRLISTASLLAYDLVHLDGTAHIYATMWAYALVHLDGAPHIYSYSVSICHRALGWGESYLQLLC
ncbi:hypothetical protein DPMN_009393 [Dreissena polymorpha]|uniref:Uncharacterized protein n=1 Tax=Dreissena polymorpha TaxID=45954 RepID=A0A9D4N078_DREPO|nr:hypothetical protein DPMN_009393 [Dreissena polymorpha]